MRLKDKRLKVGDLCYFNPENTLKLKAKATTTVKITSIERKLFSPTMYNCLSMQTGKIIRCKDNLLMRIDFIDMNPPMVQIRYSDDIPPITDSDVVTLAKLEELFSKYDKDVDLLIDIKKLKAKLEFYLSISDI